MVEISIDPPFLLFGNGALLKHNLHFAYFADRAVLHRTLRSTSNTDWRGFQNRPEYVNDMILKI